MKTVLAAVAAITVLHFAHASRIRDAGNSDDPYMMPYYTGRIFPTPQSVEYKDEFFTLSETGIILGKNVTKNDARLRYLLERITRYGGMYEFLEEPDEQKSCLIFVGDTAAARKFEPPENKQGYLIENDGKRIYLKGRDAQGLLWAISSLNQMIMIRNGDAQMQAVTVADWPTVEWRGFLSSFRDIHKLTHFMVAFKQNCIDFRKSLGARRRNWSLPRTETFHNNLKKVGEAFEPLGFRWYAGGNYLRAKGYRIINISDGKDLEFIFETHAKPILEAGGNFSVQFDDLRFPISEADEKRFGSAAKADDFFIRQLLARMKTKYPNARIAFCPPFYYGPGSKPIYKEDRDTYLRTIGEFPEEVDIYWTGPRVKGAKTTPADIEWIRERIKRKPLVFQNGIGLPHMFRAHFFTDPCNNLKSFYYEGYLDNIECYMLNCASETQVGMVISIADWNWNPNVFDPGKSIKEGMMTLTGRELYPTLEEINACVSTFDPFFGKKLSPGAVLNAEKLLGNHEELTRKLEEADTINGKAFRFWTGRSYIHSIDGFAKKLKKVDKDSALKKYAEYSRESRTMAEKEFGLDSKTDTFLSASCFVGGVGPRFYKYKRGDEIDITERFCTYIYGANSSHPKMWTSFEIDPFPPSGDYLLIISGVDDDTDKQCPIEITVNGKSIFDGPNPFENRTWNRQQFRIPGDVLKRNNTLMICNTMPTGNYGTPPFFMLNYAVLRKTKE